MLLIIGVGIIIPIICYSLIKSSKPPLDSEKADIFLKHTDVKPEDLKDLINILKLIEKNFKKIEILVKPTSRLEFKNFIFLILKTLQDKKNEEVEFESRFLIYYFSKIGLNYIHKVKDLDKICNEILEQVPKNQEIYNKKISNNISELELAVFCLLVAFNEKINLVKK